MPKQCCPRGPDLPFTHTARNPLVSTTQAQALCQSVPPDQDRRQWAQAVALNCNVTGLDDSTALHGDTRQERRQRRPSQQKPGQSTIFEVMSPDCFGPPVEDRHRPMRRRVKNNMVASSISEPRPEVDAVFGESVKEQAATATRLRRPPSRAPDAAPSGAEPREDFEIGGGVARTPSRASSSGLSLVPSRCGGSRGSTSWASSRCQSGGPASAPLADVFGLVSSAPAAFGAAGLGPGHDAAVGGQRKSSNIRVRFSPSVDRPGSELSRRAPTLFQRQVEALAALRGAASSSFEPPESRQDGVQRLELDSLPKEVMSARLRSMVAGVPDKPSPITYTARRWPEHGHLAAGGAGVRPGQLLVGGGPAAVSRMLRMQQQQQRGGVSRGGQRPEGGDAVGGGFFSARFPSAAGDDAALSAGSTSQLGVRPSTSGAPLRLRNRWFTK
mmetsp:Transcript_175538/g.562960  ORF Transcript_175538/g.562960 Transcript_175538/m.562960 type:complete len:442 (+) Transcript_175538:84-1409(+)